jgi:hypothetical protein
MSMTQVGIYTKYSLNSDASTENVIVCIVRKDSSDVEFIDYGPLKDFNSDILWKRFNSLPNDTWYFKYNGLTVRSYESAERAIVHRQDTSHENQIYRMFESIYRLPFLVSKGSINIPTDIPEDLYRSYIFSLALATMDICWRKDQDPLWRKE